MGLAGTVLGECPILNVRITVNVEFNQLNIGRSTKEIQAVRHVTIGFAEVIHHQYSLFPLRGKTVTPKKLLACVSSFDTST